jgi:hypothetical protein
VLRAHLAWLDAIDSELAPSHRGGRHTHPAEDGALMEPRGRKHSQAPANSARSKTAKRAPPATPRNRRRPSEP